MQTGKLIKEAKEHKKSITSFNFSKDGTHFITGATINFFCSPLPSTPSEGLTPILIRTASMDSTAKLWDTRTLACLKTYEAEKQVNAAAISPAAPHVPLSCSLCGLCQICLIFTYTILSFELLVL
jgi:WD40 repeat protein